MSWKIRAIIWAVLLLGAYLAGFFPQYRKASRLESELDALRVQSRMRQVRESVSLAYWEATRMNYGLAQEHADRAFRTAQEVKDDTGDEATRQLMDRLLSSRDETLRLLKAGDGSALSQLQPLMQSAQKAIAY